MDRLHVVVAVALASFGCKEGDSKNAPASGRVNAATNSTKPQKAADPSAFCDVEPGGAAKFAFPALDGEPPKAAATWRWINVWATWCKPCVEELPRLAKWTERLSAKAAPIELILLSVDETRAAIATYEKKHGPVGDTARLADPEALKPWLVGLGLDEGAPLPVHILVAPDGRARCLRSGAIADRDYDNIAALLTASR